MRHNLALNMGVTDPSDKVYILHHQHQKAARVGEACSNKSRAYSTCLSRIALDVLL